MPSDSIYLTSRTGNNFYKKTLENLSAKQKAKTLIIHDEIHKLGANSHLENLGGVHDGFYGKLGLSATPEREYDAEGTVFIRDEIGDVIFEYPLEKAIEDGILCTFNYFPIHYELTSDEKKEKRLKISRYKNQTKENPYPKEQFLREIARINKIAALKPDFLNKFLLKNRNILENSIIFVAETSQGDEVINRIHKINSNFKTYYQGTDDSYLRMFEQGQIDYLVACHVLSEGIDIPKLENILLISSDASRLETIQRIGRC